MIAEGIQKILDVGQKIHIEEIDGRKWVNRNLTRLPFSHESVPEVVGFETLTGLKEFSDDFTPPTATDIESLFFHVVSPTQVSILGQIQDDNFNKRFTYAQSKLSQDCFQFSNRERQNWYDLEMFIISLQDLSS